MDVVIQRLGDYEFSPYDRNQSLSVAQVSLNSLLSPKHRAQWTSDVSEFAQSGIPQVAILGVCAVWTLARLVLLQRAERPRSRLKVSKIRWTYEVVSQAARVAATAFLAVAFFKGRAHLLNLIVVAYAFVLGLLRLTNHLQWRHIALHQINFMLGLMLVVLAAGQLLPCIQVGSSCPRDISMSGAILALMVAFAAAAVTPRERVPLEVDLDGLPHQKPDSELSPEESCSWFTYYCSYDWLTPVIWKGTQGKLNMSHIPKIAWYDEPLYLLGRVQKARAVAKKTLWTALRFQWRELALMSFWIGTAYIVENIAPFGMFKLLDYLTDPEAATYKPWLWLLLMFFGPLSRSITFQQYVFTSTRLVVRLKSAFTQELYDMALKSMELEEDPFELHADKVDANGKKVQKSTSAGRLANLMASDVDAIYKSRDIIQVFVGIPAGTIISLVGMYRMLGWVSLVGTTILVLATPLSIWIGQRMFLAQRQARKAQDSRMSLVTEYLASLRAIKYFAWEDSITEKITEARAAEQKELWKVSVLQAVMNQVTQIFPYVSLIVMFALHVGLNKHRLDAATAFTTIFLIKNIRRNIMQASAFGRNLAAAMVSVTRLDKYFESTVPLPQYPIGPLHIQNATFRRNKQAVFTLNDITIDFVDGGLNVVCGPSGSGKSTLLFAILGETYLEGGSVTRPQDVAFASQSAWLQNETIQANILFGSPMEKARYDRVIEACCLAPDFGELPEKDLTTVGENGTSLSGGQKARVALARALYSKAPILLLDDVFAALDAKTAAGVWKHCFCGDLLKGRTTVLVTNVPWISEQGDLAIALEKGYVKSCEPNIGVVRRPITIAQVLGGDVEDDTNSPGPEAEIQPNGDSLNDANKAAKDGTRGDLVNQEMRESGKVGRLTFLQYMGYFGHPLFAFSCLLILFISNVFAFGGTLWLSVWIEAYNHKAHVDIAYYMGIFALFAFSEIVAYAVIIVMFEWGAWRAAKKLHNDFIHAIMRVSLSWFKYIPIGRITNRFSADMASIDGMLSGMLRNTLDSIMMLFFRLGAVSSITPVFIFPALFTCLFGIIVGEMYTRTAVVVKRLTSSSLSPVFSQFGDTLAGLPVIRARAGMSRAFREDLAAKLRTWSASAEAGFNANRWVAVRVDLVTALVTVSAGIIALSQTGVIAAGLVGFSLSNANSLSQTILLLVRAMNDLEVEMQSFHRVREYVKLPEETVTDEPWPLEGDYADDDSHIIPKNWPRTGEIEFRNVTIRYDPDGPNILTDVNLKFKAGERVAVVGRTGSGKSTLVLSLLRFTHVVSGQILYDGIDITKVPRHLLRQSLTIIPQEAVLFNGTVESNLDPSGRIPASILKKALDNCKGIASFSHEAHLVDGNGNGQANGNANGSLQHDAQGISLTTPVDARGENFSHGQRQVLSLCRALIRQSKLMLLDEATASMDYETDRGIQQALRQELEAAGRDRTLVTIAHRLRTIIDYDTVVVMSAGRVLEYGSPRDLYHQKGQFYDMVYHSGEMEHLQELL